MHRFPDLAWCLYDDAMAILEDIAEDDAYYAANPGALAEELRQRELDQRARDQATFFGQGPMEIDE
jgi:hypothetical protein